MRPLTPEDFPILIGFLTFLTIWWGGWFWWMKKYPETHARIAEAILRRRL